MQQLLTDTLYTTKYDHIVKGLPCGLDGKESANAGDPEFDPRSCYSVKNESFSLAPCYPLKKIVSPYPEEEGPCLPDFISLCSLLLRHFNLPDPCITTASYSVLSLQ